MRAFRRALQIDPGCAEVHDGLGVVFRQLRQPEQAVYHHMKSISLLHQRSQTHIHLGLAAAECGQFHWAIRAFEMAIGQDPSHPLPHRCLAQLYRNVHWDPLRAEQHEREARRLASARRHRRTRPG